jgi:Holliday junction resolvasome RuvABC endonuclease subunit
LNYIGIDYSVNSPAAVKIKLNSIFKIETISYIAFSSVKKTCNLDQNIVYFSQNQFKDYIAKIIWFREKIWNFLNLSQDDLIAFEGYAFAAAGKVFNIAEATFSLKQALYEAGNRIRIYEPKTIKKFATLNGNANKRIIGKAFKDSEYGGVLNHLPDYRNPKEDLIDAFYTGLMLIDEMNLRSGRKQLKDYSKKVQECFVNKKKGSLLEKEFLQKL